MVAILLLIIQTWAEYWVYQHVEIVLALTCLGSVSSEMLSGDTCTFSPELSQKGYCRQVCFALG